MNAPTATTIEKLTIPSRFNGPPGLGHGGYVCGLITRHFDGAAQVRLQQPIPLQLEMHLRRSEHGVALRYGEVTMVTATPVRVDPNLVDPPTFDAAVEASLAYAGFTHHPFPTCFVCGPHRAGDDGLRIFPGQIPSRALVAAPWIPGLELAERDGLVRPEFVWAALDCPTGWAATLSPPGDKVIVLGTFTVAIHRRPRANGRHILAAWPVGNDERKFFTAGALWSEAGELCAVADATWIQVSKEG